MELMDDSLSYEERQIRPIKRKRVYANEPDQRGVGKHLMTQQESNLNKHHHAVQCISQCQIQNMYDSLPDDLKEDSMVYDAYDMLKISMPANIEIVGTTGSGKTNAAWNIMKHVGIWTKVYLCTKLLHEPLYQLMQRVYDFIEDKTGHQILFVTTNIHELPPVETFSKEHNNLTIIDDQMNATPDILKIVIDLYAIGRKENVTNMSLWQKFYRCPIEVREQCGYFIFTKLQQVDDIIRVMKQFSLRATKEAVIAAFNWVMDMGFPNFFMIDVKTQDPALTFRHNYTPLPISLFEPKRQHLLHQSFASPLAVSA